MTIKEPLDEAENLIAEFGSPDGHGIRGDGARRVEAEPRPLTT